MTLRQLLSTLKTPSIKIQLMDVEGNDIIKFYSEGYAGVEEDILNREVKKWDVASNIAITIVLKNPVDAVPETTPDTNEQTSDTGDTPNTGD